MSHYARFKLSLQQQKNVLVYAHKIRRCRTSGTGQLNRYYALDPCGTSRENQYPIGELNCLGEVVRNENEGLLSLSVNVRDLFPERFCSELVDGTESLVH